MNPGIVILIGIFSVVAISIVVYDFIIWSKVNSYRHKLQDIMNQMYTQIDKKEIGDRNITFKELKDATKNSNAANVDNLKEYYNLMGNTYNQYISTWLHKVATLGLLKPVELL